MYLPLLVCANPSSFVTRHGPVVRLKPGKWELEVRPSRVKVALVEVKTGATLAGMILEESTEVAARVIEPSDAKEVTVFIRRLG